MNMLLPSFIMHCPFILGHIIVIWKLSPLHVLNLAQPNSDQESQSNSSFCGLQITGDRLYPRLQ